jgi:hypothetical protein
VTFLWLFLQDSLASCLILITCFLNCGNIDHLSMQRMGLALLKRLFVSSMYFTSKRFKNVADFYFFRTASPVNFVKLHNEERYKKITQLVLYLFNTGLEHKSNCVLQR